MKKNSVPQFKKHTKQQQYIYGNTWSVNKLSQDIFLVENLYHIFDVSSW